MRIFIFAPAAIVPASCVIDQAGAADRLPAFDIPQDETDAKDELAKRWSQFGATERKFCVGESSTAGEQSYVELLTCLEMSISQFSARQQ